VTKAGRPTDGLGVGCQGLVNGAHVGSVSVRHLPLWEGREALRALILLCNDVDMMGTLKGSQNSSGSLQIAQNGQVAQVASTLSSRLYKRLLAT
jgi:hypothetical protein